MNRQHLPRPARGTRLARTLCSIRVLPLPALLFNVPTCKPLSVLTSPILPRSHSHFGPHLTPVPRKSAPFFSYTYVEPIFQPLCFQIHACNGGGTPSQSCQPSKLPTLQRVSELSPLFSYLCALFCTFLHSRKNQPVSFQPLPHSLRKTPGVGGLLLTSCPSSHRTASAQTCSVCLRVKLSDSVNSALSAPPALIPVLYTGQSLGVEGSRLHLGRTSVLTSLLHYILASSSERKQHRLRRRRIGNSLQLRVLPPKRLRHLYLRSRQAVDELQRIDDGLALKVIVGDHKGLASPFGDFADSRNPRRQLFGGVEIVVTLVRGNPCIVAEPRVVAPPVKPHVPDGRGSLRGRLKRSPDDGLVDVAETDAACVQQFQCFRRIPRSVANLDHQRVVSKSLDYGGEVRYGLRSAMKRKRELQQHRAEPVRRAKHIEPRANGALVRRGRAGRCGSDVVRESLPQLRGEGEAWIRRHSIDPLRRVVGMQRLVKRSVDLDSVKEFREIARLVESFRAAQRINVAGPVGIRPARRSHAQDTCWRGIRR